MALKIPVPASSWSSQTITLGGKEYTFEYTYNTRDERWRLGIYYQGDAIITGLKIVENAPLLETYTLPDFDHGDIYCVRIKDDGENVSRNNLGYGKSYELIYVTNEELGKND